MKKIIVLLLIMFLINNYGTGVFAMEENLENIFVKSLVMQIDNPMAYTRSLDVYIDYEDKKVTPILENGICYVPMRFLFEYQGGRVKWNADTGSVVIYYNDSKFIWDSDKLYHGDKQINLEKSPVMYQERWYIPVLEWNDKVMNKELFFHDNYILLSPKGTEIQAEFWSLMDKYFRDFTGKYGQLHEIYEFSDGGRERLVGLADKDGNVIIAPKYYDLVYTPNKPIITKGFTNDKSNRICTVISEDEEVLFSCTEWLSWVRGEPLSLSYGGGFGGERSIGRTYDITGECMDLRVGENLMCPQFGEVPAGNAYTNGLQSRVNPSGKSQLVNKSGNILYEAMLPDGLFFPQRRAGTEIIIHDDCLVIYDANNQVWGMLDLEGNLIPN